MRIVKEEQRYWNYNDWQKTFAWYYQPLINNNLISNFQSKVSNKDVDDYITVSIEYIDTREPGDDQGMRSLTPPEPTQLPPHTKADYIITLTTPTINDALAIINDYKKYWPEMDMNNLSISQNKDEEAVAILILANYEADIEVAELEEGDIQTYE